MPPSVRGLTTPISGNSSAIMNRAPPMVNSQWPMRPSSPTTRIVSKAPKASR